MPEPLEGAEVFALDSAALLAGTRFRGDFEERFKAVIGALQQRPRAILFIDEIHTAVGAGATSAARWTWRRSSSRCSPPATLRVIGSTTFEEFKQIEKDRALARRLQRIAIDEPTHGEAVQILEGLRPATRSTTRSPTRDAAIDAAVKLAARHLRDVRLPDSAIDIMDEAGAMFGCSPAGCRRRRDRAAAADGAADAPTPTRRTVEPADIERVVARMARIPTRQASASDRERLRTLEESLGRVVFGQPEAVHAVARRSSGRGRGSASRTGRRGASCSPGRPASARRNWPSSSRCTWATSSSAST